MSVLRLSFLVGTLLVVSTRSQELKDGTACKEELLQLVCGTDEVLVIHQAVFDGQDSEGCGFLMPINISSLLPAKNETDDAAVNGGGRRFSVQSSINKRCNGLNNCTLQLDSDEPSAKNWGEGKLRVLYNCIPAKSAKHSCDGVIEIVTPDSVSARALVSSTTALTTAKPAWVPGPVQTQGWGYLQQMGYPEYYRGPSECRWTIRATHGRRVRLTVLDLSIRTALAGERECKDVLTVTENSRMLLNKCGEVEEPVVIESSGDEINVTLSVKSPFIPKRGLMAYFTAMGCPTPKTPKQAYLVSGHNSSRAEFVCCVDHVFPDTGLRFRNLTCLEQEGHKWDQDLPDCVDIKHIQASGNKSLIHILRKAMNQSGGPEMSELTNYNLTYDFIVPSSIIAGLILGNIIVLALVLHCRRRNEKPATKSDGGEESVPLQDTPGPSDVIQSGDQRRVGTPV